MAKAPSKTGPATTQRAASHCDALLKPQAAPHDLTQELERFGERLAGALRPVLSARQVRSLGARALKAGELAGHCGPAAANSVHMLGKNEVPVLLSLDAKALLAQLDRAFGGTGEVTGKLPTELPLSADLLAKRMEQQTITAVAGELGGIDAHAGRRATNVGQLALFRPAAMLTLIELEVTPADGGAAWTLSLVVETDSVPTLLPHGSLPRPAAARRQSDANSAPFADLPLSANATLVDMEVPLHRLTGLVPGDVLPIMVARSVPLRIGDAIIASGTVGEVDEQVALQITQTSIGKETQ
ncbi:MAG TPA: FliM/FliN family flagellar motor switch protein [Croceibacterium sp.]|nr:FliM/FliN family flagellar motor switch protein [Croceibacterium sp.]